MRDFEDLLASLVVLAWVVEARDPYTGGHLWRVSRYAALLGQATDLSRDAVARLQLGALVHDLGKVGVPDAVLRKPDRLSAAEYDIIKTHPGTGIRMLAGHPLTSLVRDVMVGHHERVDGRGYPYGLKGDAIPMEARLVAVCDTFDALTSHRPFRHGCSAADATDVMWKEGQGQFDQTLLAAFVDLQRGGLLDHVLACSDDGIPLRECPTCGPLLVVRREHVAGDEVTCGNCARAFRLERRGESLSVEPEGRPALARELAPQADEALIRRLVTDAVAALPADSLRKIWSAPV